jgi:purine-binding chemotaxis protein CheW
MSTAATAAEPAQYLTFHLAGEEYAIGILRVREIIQYEAITRVPTAPPSIRGVINLRGSVVPVVDLAVRFGLASTEVTKWTCIVIAEVEMDGERTVMGVLADSVSQVVDLLPEDIREAPSFGTRARVDHLLGMARMGRKFALILDIDRVLSEEDLRGALLSAPDAGDEAHDDTAPRDAA